MASISKILRKDKITKQNVLPIYFRITKNRKTRYISTGVYLSINQWDDANKRVKSNHPNSARLNKEIDARYTELQDQLLKLEGRNVNVTTSQLKEALYGKKPTGFFEVANELVETYKEEGKIGTHDKNKSIIKKLKVYAKNRALDFQDIDSNFLSKYETYMRNELNNKVNTIATNMRFIRRVFNYAIRQDMIDYSINPFLKKDIKTEKTTKTYLTEEELSRLEALELKAGQRLDLHRDMFVFACYAGGPRISDLLCLTWKQYDGTHISYTSKKTTTQIEIKLPDKALAIIKKYKTIDKKGNDFIFPIFQPGYNLQDAVFLDTKISGATAYINKNLIILAEKAEIVKHLSFHISRHTWATRALRKGMPIEQASRIIGHSDLRQILVYAKIVKEDLNNAMDLFND